MERFWPGPLTLLFPKSEAVSRLCTAGVPTVAVRMPSHPIARALIAQSGLPLAAPSANLSGRPSPTTGHHVLADLGGRIPCIIAGGPCHFGVESTVVDLWHQPPLVLRPGGVTVEQLREVVPDIELFSADRHGAGEVERPATPGLKYKHYSPDTQVLLLTYAAGLPGAEVGQRVADYLLHHQLPLLAPADSVALVHTQTSVQYPEALLHHPRVHIHSLASPDSEAELLKVAAGLFSSLRSLDQQDHVKLIAFLSVPEAGTGVAIMNRIRKAATLTVEV